MTSDQPVAYEKMEASAEARTGEVMAEIRRTWRLFCAGNALMAETKPVRQGAASVRKDLPSQQGPDPRSLANAESFQGPRDNFRPVSFLAEGAAVARAVAKVAVGSTGQVGTGFICSPGLFITNRHVLPDPAAAHSARIEFDFLEGEAVQPTHYRLDPEACFVVDEVEERDYAIVKLGDRIGGPSEPEAFGWCPMSDASDKHSIGEFANIIQHPEGGPKQVVLQDNLIAARSDFALHYLADTLGGSSGSPVFNNEWQAIALHHWGAAFNELTPDRNYDPNSVNEGIRISQIISHVREQFPALPAREQKLMMEMIDLGLKVPPESAMSREAASRGFRQVAMQSNAPEMLQKPDRPQAARSGVATWTIPIQVSVAIPGHEMFAGVSSASEAERGAMSDYGRAGEKGAAAGAEASLPVTGEGYRPDFLDNHMIELPKLREEREDDIAPLKKPDNFPSARFGELQFTHFSVIVNRRRKLPFFGACNVDGATLFGINSKLDAYDYADMDEKIFASKAEGGHSWRHDRRIEKDDQTVDDWYIGKNRLLPRQGTDDAERYIEIADFDRGHIVRRTEPIWGELNAGRAANRQTFNVANAAPQTPQFNQDKTRDVPTIDEGEEQRSWYGMEVAVLRAATNDNAKMNVFTGPIFKDDDPVYGPGKAGNGDRQIPLSFWKIAVWEDGGMLKTLAMKYSQTFSLLKPKPGAGGGAEALDTAQELLLLRDFLTTVEDIENRTDILFGEKVRDADLLKDFKNKDFAKLKLADFKDLLA